MASSGGKIEVFRGEKLIFMMHLGCIFVKTKVAFVAESYITVSQNIQIYFAALQLDARFDPAAKPKVMLASTGKETVEQKIWSSVRHNVVVVGLLLSYYGVIIYGGCSHTSISTAG